VTPAVRCDDLHPFFDGELSQAQSDAFREHLAGCAKCQRELDEVIQLQGLSEELAAEQAAPKPSAATKVVDFQEARKRRRPLAWATGGIAVLAAAAAVVLAVRPSGDGDLYGLGASRPLEARLTHQGAREHRTYDVKRSASGGTGAQIPLAGLARLEERGDQHGLATGYLLRGEREQAAQALAKAGASPDVRSDLAVVALQKGAADEALLLLDSVLEERPGHPQATWNRGLALRELGLPLAAAEAFEQVVKLREPGWAQEAADRANALSGEARRAEASWKAAFGAGTALVSRGEPVPAELLRSHPGLLRGFFYDALRTATSAERVRQLRPVAEALDASFGGQYLTTLLEREARDDFARRAPLSQQYAQLIGSKLDAPAVGALLSTTQKAGFPLLRLGVLYRTRNVAQHLAEYQALAGELGDPWFTGLAQFEAGKAESARRPLEAERQLRKALQFAQAHQLQGLASVVELELSDVDIALYRVADAWGHALTAHRLARATQDDAALNAALYALAGAARLRRAVALSRAYLREALLRNPGNCAVEGFVRATLTNLAMVELDTAAVRRELDAEASCPDTAPLHTLGMRVDLARLEPREGDAARITKDAAALRASGKLADGELLVVDAFEGQMLIDHDGRGAALLQRTIAAADKHPGDVDAAKARGHAYVGLQLDAARRGSWAEVFPLLAAEAAVPARQRCALGLFIADGRTGVAVLSSSGQASGQYDSARRLPMMRWEPRVEGPLLEALAGCEVVDVLARAPVQGRTDVLPPQVAWRYLLHGGARPAPAAQQRLVIDDVEAPPSLGLPRLTPGPLTAAGTSAIDLRGASATPSRALAAMRSATEIEIHAHGLSDLSVSDEALLVLSPDADGSYALSARDVRAARLEGAPLVTLAACRGAQSGTALHTPVSLPAAFIAAGARGVFAAQSDVQDSQARPFFEGVQARMREGKAPAVALRDERMAWMGRPGAAWAQAVLLFE
jgi:hypothetical protein